MDVSLAARLRQGALLLTANARLGRRLRREYGQLQALDGPPVWSSPRILTWEAWLDRCWQTVLLRTGRGQARLGSWAEQILWERVIEGSGASAGLLLIENAAALASEAWSLLHAWRVPLDSPLFDLEEDPKAFQQWGREFAACALDGGWIEDAGLADFAAENFAAGLIEAPEEILLAGFDEPTPQQQELLEVLRGRGARIELSPDTARGGRAGLIKCQDARDEISSAARWARSCLERDPGASIAVVVAGLPEKRDEIERVFLEVFHPDALSRSLWPRPIAFHLSLGIPLAKYPVVEPALLVLQLAAGRLDLASAGGLLHSPYLKGSREEAADRARLDAALREWGEVEVTPALLGRLARRDGTGTPVLAACLSQWMNSEEAQPRPRSAAQWAPAITKLLQTFGWPGERPPDSREHQAIERWKELLSEFASLSGVTGTMHAAEAAALLSRMARETFFQVEDEGSPVQIMGIGETGGLEAGRLWLLGMHEEAWPPGRRPHPFLPLGLQRKHNLPDSSPARANSTWRQVTARLLSAATEVIVSYPAADGETELRPSPLYSGLAATDAPAPEYPRWAQMIAGRSELQQFIDETGPSLPAGYHQRGGAQIFQQQAACPFRAFAALRLHAEPLAEPSLGWEPFERGRLLHKALALCWGEIQTRERLARLTETDVGEIVARNLQRSMEEIRAGRQGPLEARLRRLELQVLRPLLARWFQMEAERERGFAVLELEAGRDAEIGGLRFNLRVDRADRLEDGSLFVVDYKLKSTAVGPGSWETDRPDEPQLPLYAVTSEKAPAALAFGLFLPGEVEFRGLSARPGMVSGVKHWDKDKNGISWDEKLAEWRRVLERLAQNFREGRAEVDPKAPGQTCEHCAYPVLCRIHEEAGENG